VAGTARAAAGLADALITVHEPLRQLSIARGVASDKISVVMNSADPVLFDPARHPRRPFMADGVLRLIHHSSLQPIYGLDVAVEAISRLGDALPLQLNAYGDGPFRPALEAAIARTGTAERVHLRGQVPIEQLPGMLAAADLALVPTRPEPYLEYSLPTKLLEYAAMGVPTITTDLRTVRAHFSDAALRYVPGADPDALAAAIREAVADPKATLRRGKAARREAAAYAWPSQARAYLDLVERLIGSSSARRG
jgi:glycosyltransferase involved in cell wall biosynthesis